MLDLLFKQKRTVDFEHDVNDNIVENIIKQYNGSKYNIKNLQTVLDTFSLKGYSVETRGIDAYVLVKDGKKAQRTISFIKFH